MVEHRIYISSNTKLVINSEYVGIRLKTRLAILRRIDALLIGIVHGRTVSESTHYLSKITKGLSRERSALLVEDFRRRFHSILSSSSSDSLELSEEQINALVNYYRATRKAQSEINQYRRMYPSTLTWYVTEMCSRKCKYCYRISTNHSICNEFTSEPLRFEEAIDILTEFAWLGVKKVNLTGGEPFQRSDIIDIIRYINSYDIHITAATKHHFSKSEISSLCDIPNLALYFSLDTHVERIQRKLTGIVNHVNKVKSSINQIRNSTKVDVRISTVVTKHNYGTFEGFLDFVEELGVKHILVSPMQEVLCGIGSTHEYTAKRQMLLSEKEISQLYNIVSKTSSDLQITLLGQDEIDSHEGKGYPFCENGSVYMLMGPNGTVHKCDSLLWDKDLIVGNLRKQSPISIWNSEKLISMSNPPIEMYTGTRCNSCSMINECNASGRCINNSYLGYGSYFNIDRRCSEVLNK